MEHRKIWKDETKRGACACVCKCGVKYSECTLLFLHFKSILEISTDLRQLLDSIQFTDHVLMYELRRLDNISS